MNLPLPAPLDSNRCQTKDASKRAPWDHLPKVALAMLAHRLHALVIVLVFVVSCQPYLREKAVELALAASPGCRHSQRRCCGPMQLAAVASPTVAAEPKQG